MQLVLSVRRVSVRGGYQRRSAGGYRRKKLLGALATVLMGTWSWVTALVRVLDSGPPELVCFFCLSCRCCSVRVVRN